MRARQFVLALSSSIIAQLILGVLIAHSAPVAVPSDTPVEIGTPVSAGVPDTVLNFTGCASPYAFVTIFDNNNPAGTVIADGSGRFSKKIVAQKYGLHNIKAYFDDVNNRTSSTITKNISLTAHSVTNLDLLLPTTIEHEPEPVKIGNYLIFRGTTCPFSLVNVIINNNFTLAAQANDRGNWYVIANTEDYYIGAHIYEALSSVNDQTSLKTQKYQFTTIGKNSSYQPKPPDLTIPTITNPPDQFLSSTKNIIVSGTGPNNSQIEIYIDDVLRGSVYTNPIGEWSFNMTMLDTLHSVKVRSCFQNKCSEFSQPTRISFGGELARCSLNFTLSSYRFYNLTKNEGLDLNITNLTGSPEYETLIDWGDATIEHATLLNDSFMKMHHVYKQNGQFNGVITILDSIGCSHSQYFSVQIEDKASPDLLYLAIIPFTAILIYSIARSLNIYRRNPETSEQLEDKPSLLPPIRHFPKPVFGQESAKTDTKTEQDESNFPSNQITK